MDFNDDTDGEVANPLCASGILTAEQLVVARGYQSESGGSLSEAVLRLNLVKEAEYLRVFAELYETRFLKASRLASLKIDELLVSDYGMETCVRLRMCPIRFDREAGELNVVAAIPLATKLTRELKRRKSVKTLNVYVAAPGVVAALLRRSFLGDTGSIAQVTANGAGPDFPPPVEDVGDVTAPPVAREATVAAKEGGTVVVKLSDLENHPAETRLETLERENARFRIAQEFNRRVSLERTPEAMVDRILEVMFELLPADGAAIWLQTNEVRSKTRSGAGEVTVPRAVIDQTLKSDQVVLVNNALIDERFDRSESVVVRGIQSVMSTPLRTREGVLGILYVESVSQKAAFSATDLPLLDSIAAQASILLDNAVLLARVQREVETRVNLSRFLSPAAVEEVVSGRMTVNMEGLEADITVLFADLRGFTTLSAHMKPDEVVAFLNGFFREAVEAVERHHGIVDKFIGDCVMAIWGAPVARDSDARDALNAAQEIIEGAARVMVNGKAIEVGVGINSGPAVVGAIGTKQRSDYTAIGSTVNVASRLCAIANVGEVLLTSDTLMRAGPGIVTTARESVVLKGLDVPVVPYSLKKIVVPLKMKMVTPEQLATTVPTGVPAVTKE